MSTLTITYPNEAWVSWDEGDPVSHRSSNPEYLGSRMLPMHAVMFDQMDEGETRHFRSSPTSLGVFLTKGA